MRLVTLFFMFFFVSFPSWADDALDNALRATYTACVGIDEQLHDMKVMAGINTAITSVGTATGIGATATGFVKAAKDKRIAEIEVQLEQLRKIEQSGTGSQNTTSQQLNSFVSEFEKSRASMAQNLKDFQNEIDKLTGQSKKLGNWRTGLLAGTAATNIAGTVIAATNRVEPELEEQVSNCVRSVINLRNVMMQSRVMGTDISEAETIARTCGEFEYVDLKPINKRALGAAISGGVGAGTAIAGTITSGIANSDKTRADDTDSGKQKEKNLNTAANVLSVGATAATITATVFNATQIAAIKKVATVASACTGVLQ